MKILFLTLYTFTCLNALAQNQSDKPLCEKCVDDQQQPIQGQKFARCAPQK